MGHCPTKCIFSSNDAAEVAPSCPLQGMHIREINSAVVFPVTVMTKDKRIKRKDN